MKKQSFNRNWKFAKSGGAWSAAMKEGANSDNVVTLPHDAMILEKRNADNPAGAACGYFPGGSYEYAKVLHAASEDVGKTYILQFEGVYNRGWVTVNGTVAGSVNSGYDELKLDITPYQIGRAHV